jgi:hypothetical protein
MLGLDLTPFPKVSRYESRAQQKSMKAFILLQKQFPQESVFEASDI